METFIKEGKRGVAAGGPGIKKKSGDGSNHRDGTNVMSTEKSKPKRGVLCTSSVTGPD